MTLDERIRAAAASIGRSHNELTLVRPIRIGQAERALKAAFPELFSTPPTAWIAPWEIEMQFKSGDQVIGDAKPLWDALRSAHLGDTPNLV